MPNVWPIATIRELLALADANGEAKATLGTYEEAELFRYAIYNFRRAHNMGQDMTITIEPSTTGMCVVVTKRQTPAVTIVQEQEQEV